jgi:caa(3)-type oxidase subunit IV
MSEGATTRGSPYKIYWVTWGILLVITVAMLAAEKFHLPRLFLVLFLVVFMLVKATMITGNFMHLRYEQRNLAFIVAAGLLVTSAILFSFITPESISVRARRSEPVPAPPTAPAHSE